MKKTCKHCGRVHERGFNCPMKPVRRKENNEVNRFRWSRKWTAKREVIRERDNHLCQVCVRNLFDTHTQYNSENIEVHHIVPIAADWERRLDDDNLICLCTRHHKMAESGAIAASTLLKLVAECYK